MSMRDLVEGECGGSNSLVQLSTHFVQDHALRDQDLKQDGHPDQSFLEANTGELADQYFSTAEPDTFKMDNLLEEMRSTEETNVSNQQEAAAWPTEYEVQKDEGEYDPNIWSTTDNKMLVKDEIYDFGYGPDWVKKLESSNNKEDAVKSRFNFEKPKENETILDGTVASPTIVDSVLQEQTNLDPFLTMMMENIANKSSFNVGSYGNLLFDFQNLPQNADFNRKWELEDAASDHILPSSSNADAPISAIGEPISSTDQEQAAETINNDKNISFMSNIMNNLRLWESEFRDMRTVTEIPEYLFNQQNEMESIENPLAEGKRRLEAGELSTAVLCFEAAVKQDASNAEAWQLLGTTQAENEQDQLGISALHKCLELQPDNLTAVLCLAACYTNESCNAQACRMLMEWLNQNPKYKDIVKSKQIPDEPKKVDYLFTSKLYDSVKDMYIEAAQRSAEMGFIDADVQNGLGVLLNLNNENDKAVDCFKAALQVKPDDARLWNRLGATLANGGKSEEAIESYRNALQLCPGFTRARYNLGITCIHLETYREAIEHLLEALNQQASAVSSNAGTPALSDTIWSTLRLAISLSDRIDLFRAVNDRNLDLLNAEFNIKETKENSTTDDNQQLNRD
ncbi:peroxisomal targeting signal 1 receptor isoform X1 [Adelges cooleyi]|uniref:peroxisomal targeting signal 1 receptor isoform X1 n=1 Tax=Adelges cooleyi TaxID=133065 RepID=UPI002180011C|nr:peroxisomal targeting signal 1 receptor isoform X1 [Adelges cooleyi]XP_050443101.1 peroxisomal targeting signal 1 receptor isoform X1 [Adelges cooleyi]